MDHCEFVGMGLVGLGGVDVLSYSGRRRSLTSFRITACWPQTTTGMGPDMSSADDAGWEMLIRARYPRRST